MPSKLPKVSRRDGRSSAVTYALVAAALMLGVVIAVLMSSGGLFTDEPASDAERDYVLLLDAAKTSPKDPAILMTLAETEWRIGKKDEALRHARLAVDNSDELPGYRLRYAALLLLNDDKRTAREIIESEIDLKTPRDAEPFFLRAQLNRAEKKFDAAIADMEKGLALAPTSADMRILFGDILAEAGEKKRAISEYEAALGFLPGDERAIEGLARLGVKPPPSVEPTAHSSGASDQ